MEVYEDYVDGKKYYVNEITDQYYDPETGKKVPRPKNSFLNYKSDEDSEDTDEEPQVEEEDIEKRFGDKRYDIFLRALNWKPYPEARAKKGEKGRADYKKEGRVGFFEDFPEVPYWQGQLGLVLYMDKVDFMEGKKKKRKKVAKDRVTDRTYMYNPDTEMYEEKTQADGYPDAAEKVIKVFDNKVCLAEQQGLKKLHKYYDMPEGLKELNYYIEEEYDDIFDCNCNHLGKFSGYTMKIVGQANRYDWVKSEVQLGMFLAREQVNTILMELDNYENDPATYDFDEDLLEYERQYAQGLTGKFDEQTNEFFGNETSKLVAFQASPTADYDEEGDGEYFGQQGYGSIKLVDIRTEEEKLMKYEVPEWEEGEDEPEPRELFRETNKIVIKPPKAAPAKAEKPKKPKKEKKPRTQAQLDALAKAREKMAKKKAQAKQTELKKSEK